MPPPKRPIFNQGRPFSQRRDAWFNSCGRAHGGPVDLGTAEALRAPCHARLPQASTIPFDASPPARTTKPLTKPCLAASSDQIAVSQHHAITSRPRETILPLQWRGNQPNPNHFHSKSLKHPSDPTRAALAQRHGEFRRAALRGVLSLEESHTPPDAPYFGSGLLWGGQMLLACRHQLYNPNHP